ncbi:hypothetical protein [Polaromonas sp. CG9_12]|nr:hypothetical protein [Polaromonas sp. CG9_12]
MVIPEAEKYLIDLGVPIFSTVVYRWPQAEPYSHVGRASDLARYREDSAPSSRRVLLAGDFMSMPYTEGAAESGQWAAGQIIRAVSRRAL